MFKGKIENLKNMESLTSLCFCPAWYQAGSESDIFQYCKCPLRKIPWHKSRAWFKCVGKYGVTHIPWSGTRVKGYTFNKHQLIHLKLTKLFSSWIILSLAIYPHLKDFIRKIRDNHWVNIDDNSQNSNASFTHNKRLASKERK